MDGWWISNSKLISWNHIFHVSPKCTEKKTLKTHIAQTSRLQITICSDLCKISPLTRCMVSKLPFFNEKSSSWYKNGIQSLVKRCDEVIDKNGEYILDWLTFNICRHQFYFSKIKQTFNLKTPIHTYIQYNMTINICLDKTPNILEQNNQHGGQSKTINRNW